MQIWKEVWSTSYQLIFRNIHTHTHKLLHTHSVSLNEILEDFFKRKEKKNSVRKESFVITRLLQPF